MAPSHAELVGNVPAQPVERVIEPFHPRQLFDLYFRLTRFFAPGVRVARISMALAVWLVGLAYLMKHVTL